MADEANLNEDGIDYSKYSPDQVEQDMAGGNLVPEGNYRAVLDGAEQVTSKKSDLPGWKLTFKITDGPFAGRKVEDTLWRPNLNKPATINRSLLFKHRLGVIARSADGKCFEPVPNVTDFRDVLDRAVIIAVKVEPWETEDKKKSGESNRLEFNGLYAPDDAKAVAALGPKSPKEAKGGTDAKATPKGAPSANGQHPPAKKKFDAADL